MSYWPKEKIIEVKKVQEEVLMSRNTNTSEWIDL